MQGLDKKHIIIIVAAVVVASIVIIAGVFTFGGQNSTDVEPGEIKTDMIDVTAADHNDSETQNESDEKTDVGVVTEETTAQIETITSASKQTVLDASNDGHVSQEVVDEAKTSLDGAVQMVSSMPVGLTELTSSLQEVSNTYFFGQLNGLDRLYDCVSNGGTVYNDKVYVYDNESLNENVYKASFVVTQPSDQYAYTGVVFDGYYDATVDMFKIINYTAVKDVNAAFEGLN